MRFLRARRATSVVLTALTMAAAGQLATAPADAAAPVTPGSFTGYAFDACSAPSQAQMDRWLTSSPFLGVGVYIGGSSRKCEQPDLTATWVSRQTHRGWKVLPIWVGPQAACTTYAHRIDDSPANDYVAARNQGRTQAARAVRQATALGIPERSTLWYDLEDFDLQASDDCRRSALSFLSGWTKRMHGLGYTSGVYANVAAAIHALDFADTASPGSYAMPDQIWYAWNNGRADTSIARKWVRPGSWARDRVHQYQLDTSATYDGVTLHIDRNFMDVGRGSVAPRPTGSCGVRVDFPDYRVLKRGSTGGQVKAAQCLLKKQRKYHGRVHGRFDVATTRAVRSFQRSRDLKVTGRVAASVWTVLLSDGTNPVLKRGSASNAVRRVQRALNVAPGTDLKVTGVFSAGTTTAVKRYQKARRLPRTGVVASDTWRDLEAGRR
jgi:hypothetical protein